MGMDLIGAGFTTKNTDTNAIAAAVTTIVDALTDAILTDDDLLNQIDPSGGQDFPDAASVRDVLKEGVDEYVAALDGHRMTVHYDIPGTDLAFTFAGGGSWGDEPFDGFDSLITFLNACDAIPEIGAAAGFVCGGLPSVSIAAGHIA